MNSRCARAVLAVGVSFWLAGAAIGQSFNIDLDVGFGGPGIGNGAPSPSFGGAAGQSGFWNRLGTAGGDPQPLRDLLGGSTTVQLQLNTTSIFAMNGFAFGANTSDYALLLNDAAVVAPSQDGGTLSFRIAELLPGSYSVYTYAANTSGIPINTPVYVPGAVPNETQIVTGPMPGNAFEHLITHSIHSIDVPLQAFLDIIVIQPPQMHTSMCINGIQIVTVSEPVPGLIVMCAGGAFLILRRRGSH